MEHICKNCHWFSKEHGCCNAISEQRGKKDSNRTCPEWEEQREKQKRISAKLVFPFKFT